LKKKAEFQQLEENYQALSKENDELKNKVSIKITIYL